MLFNLHKVKLECSDAFANVNFQSHHRLPEFYKAVQFAQVVKTDEKQLVAESTK